MSEVIAGAGASDAMVSTSEPEVEEELDAPRQGHWLTDTGNGPLVSYEEALLKQYFGEPDEKGVYGGRS